MGPFAAEQSLSDKRYLPVKRVAGELKVIIGW